MFFQVSTVAGAHGCLSWILSVYSGSRCATQFQVRKCPCSDRRMRSHTPSASGADQGSQAVPTCERSDCGKGVGARRAVTRIATALEPMSQRYFLRTLPGLLPVCRPWSMMICPLAST